MTEDEKKKVVQEVLNQIKADSQSVDELTEVTSLDNVKSLPAMKGETLVSAPISLLSKPAEDAATVATTAATAANEAATKAETATTKAEEATTKANEAAEVAEDAATKFVGSISVDEIDNIPASKDDAYTMIKDLPHSRWTLTYKYSDTSTLNVGVIDIFSDNMHHQLTEVLTTHYGTTDGGLDFTKHTDSQIFTYWRSYNLTNAAWTDWQEFVPSSVQTFMGVKNEEVAALQTSAKELTTSLATTNNTVKALEAATEEAVSALQTDMNHLNETMGPYSERESIVLTATATGYVIDSNGAKVAKAGWAMAEFTAEKGNVYLFKPGATDGNVSVFAEAISSVETRGIDYTYTYNEDGTIATAVATYNGKTHSYTYTYDESGNCTIKEGTTVINELPMTYTTTVGSYSPLVRLNANAELPKDGYCRYMSHFKGNSAIKVVVSYKVGSADLTMKVTRDGVLASISTQLGNLSQKEDETRSQLAEKAPTIWARILATKDCAIKIDGKIVELPAHKNVIVRDFTQVNAYASPDYCAPRNITKFEIHTNGIAKLKAFSLLAGYSATKDGESKQWRAMDGIESLDLSCIDASEVTVFQGMFRQLSHTKLKELDVSGFDLSNAKNAYMMFAGCSSVMALDVSGFQVNKVQDHSITQLFSGCSSLTTLDVANWDTSSVTNISSVFSGCSSLTALDVSAWDTSSVTNMQNIFAGCYKLTNLIFGPKWGKQTSTEANALTLDLYQVAASANYKLTDATWASMLTMYDRKSAGLADMTIKLSTKHNVPDGWTDKMVARGYVITLV